MEFEVFKCIKISTWFVIYFLLLVVFFLQNIEDLDQTPVFILN